MQESGDTDRAAASGGSGGAASTGQRRTWVRMALALASAGAIFGVATLTAVAASSALSGIFGYGVTEGVRPPGDLAAQPAAKLGIFLLTMQTTTIVLSLAAARLFSSGMPLYWPRYGLGGILLSILVLLLLTGAFGALFYAVDRASFAADMKPFADMARTDAWWILLLAAAIGAPLAEEFLFRGFLFGALRDTPAGFSGTALATAVMWAALHANYSIYGISMIIMIGLYFAYLRERSGTLVPSIAAHAFYNGSIVLALGMAPENAIPAP